jgi:hypothetical protein
MPIVPVVPSYAPCQFLISNLFKTKDPSPLNEYGKIKIKDIVLRKRNLFSYTIDFKLIILRAVKKIKKIRGKIYYLTNR